MNHNELWKILKEMGIPDHLTRLWRNLYAGQEASVLRRSAFVIVQLSHLYMTSGKTTALTRRTFFGKVMRNAGLEEAQAVIKIAMRNINNLRHADDTTLTAESEEELKSLLMKVKRVKNVA